MTDGSVGASMERWLATLDGMVFRVERTIVTLAAVVMTSTVTLDIVYRSFASEDSQIARKLAALLAFVGFPISPNTHTLLHQWVAPWILAGITVAIGWGCYGAIRRRQERARTWTSGLAWGVATLAAGWGFVQLVVHVPSRWVCLGLLISGCAAYGLDALRRNDPSAAILSLLFGGLGGWGCFHLPQAYIWSQELSLILLSWLAFLGASMATRVQRHIIVDALRRAIPSPLRPWTRALGLLTTTLFCGYLVLIAYAHIFGPAGDLASGEIRPATGIPAWTITLPMLLAFCVMTLRFGAATIHAFSHPSADGGQTPPHAPTSQEEPA